MIEVDRISVYAGGSPLLKGVRLCLTPSRLTAVLGPNGAGKTTLLRVICGDLTPAQGAIRMNGRTLAEWTRLERARRRAVLLQESSLRFPFSSLEVVLMGRAPHVDGRERLHDREIARRALAAVHADRFAGRSYPTLSGGEKQRVQLARVLAQVWEPLDGETRYLLLDEPTSSLDPLHQHVVLDRLRRFAGEGGSVLMILHDLNLAAQYADEVILLDRGSVVASGRTVEALTESNLNAAFGLPMRVLHVAGSSRPFIHSPREVRPCRLI